MGSRFFTFLNSTRNDEARHAQNSYNTLLFWLARMVAVHSDCSVERQSARQYEPEAQASELPLETTRFDVW